LPGRASGAARCRFCEVSGITSESLAILRRFAIKLRGDTAKGSMRVEIKKAGWQNDFLLSLLRQMR